MITAIVLFKLPSSITYSQVEASFLEAAPMFERIPGLIHKQFLLSNSGNVGGGVYLWESAEAANRFYTPEFRQLIAKKYGAEPTITYFNTPVVVESALEAIAY